MFGLCGKLLEAVSHAGRAIGWPGIGPAGGRKRSLPVTDGDRGNKKPRSDAASLEESQPDEPQCYICWETASEGTGQPLRRDCSCRGSGGFAHYACLVQDATRRSHNVRTYDPANIVGFMDHWKNCPQCKQTYQNQLGLDLAWAFEALVHREYPHSPTIHLFALQLKADVLLSHYKLAAPRKEAIKILRRMLVIVGQLKQSYATSSFPRWAADMEGSTNFKLGSSFLDAIILGEDPKKSVKEAWEYLQRAQDIFKSIGADQGVCMSDVLIKRAKSLIDGKGVVMGEDDLNARRKGYELSIASHGEGGVRTLTLGLLVARAFQRTSQPIKAEKLLMNLAATSTRIHGPAHGITLELASALRSCKVRSVEIRNGSEVKLVQAMRYKEGGETLVIRWYDLPVLNIGLDPIRIHEDTVACDIPTSTVGTPVVCHFSGQLTRSSRKIDGKIGIVRAWSDKRDCYEIRFEDDDLEPRWVKRKDVRILFELP